MSDLVIIVLSVLALIVLLRMMPYSSYVERQDSFVVFFCYVAMIVFLGAPTSVLLVAVAQAVYENLIYCAAWAFSFGSIFSVFAIGLGIGYVGRGKLNERF